MKSFISLLCCFVILLASGCKPTPEAAPEIIIAEQTEVITEASSEPTASPTPNADALLAMEKTSDGFQLAYTGQDDFYISQTLISPPIEGKSYVVHVGRTLSGDSNVTFKRDAIIVDPETSEFRTYPLYNALVKDDYQVDSVAITYGFLDDRHLLYVSAVNDSDSYYYRIEKLNVLTGETTILIPEIPKLPNDDHFAPGWLNDAKDTLVLNSYRIGQLWTYDLLKGVASLPKESFSHSWPFFSTMISPDGEQFWYIDYAKRQYRLYDKNGNLLSTEKFGKGYNQYPALLWSPDSMYATYQDTKEQSGEHIIGNTGEFDVIAPQQIKFFNRQGKMIHTLQTDAGSKKSIEVAGWLDESDGVALLHEYELGPIINEQKTITQSRYLLLDVHSGTTRALRLEPDLDQLKEPLPALTSKSYFGRNDSHIYVIDTKSLLISILAQNGKWLSEPNELQATWLTFGDEPATTSYHIWDRKTGQINETLLGDDSRDISPLGSKWLVSDDMQYTRIE